jgi:hypothetical protein
MKVKLSLNSITKLKDTSFENVAVSKNGWVLSAEGEVYKKPKNRKNEEVNQMAMGDDLGGGEISSGIDTEATEKEEGRARRRERVINKKEVRGRIMAMAILRRSNPLLLFVTVTFKAGTTDEQGYRMLNHWLTRCRQEKVIINYLWIAERQQNGTIHYHIAVTRRFPIVRGNELMRLVMIGEVKRGKLDMSYTEVNKYNGVDLAKDRKTRQVINFGGQQKGKSLGRYLSKYMGKGEQSFNHAAWHCSRLVSGLVYSMNFDESELSINGISKYVKSGSVYENEFCKVYGWRDSIPDFLIERLRMINRVFAMCEIEFKEEQRKINHEYCFEWYDTY